MDVLLVKMRFRGNLHLGEISKIFGLDKSNLFLENVIANPDGYIAQWRFKIVIRIHLFCLY